MEWERRKGRRGVEGREEDQGGLGTATTGASPWRQISQGGGFMSDPEVNCRTIFR